MRAKKMCFQFFLLRVLKRYKNAQYHRMVPCTTSSGVGVLGWENHIIILFVPIPIMCTNDNISNENNFIEL